MVRSASTGARSTRSRVFSASATYYDVDYDRSHRCRSEHGAHESGRLRALHRSPSACRAMPPATRIQCDGAGIPRRIRTCKARWSRSQHQRDRRWPARESRQTQQTGVDVNLDVCVRHVVRRLARRPRRREDPRPDALHGARPAACRCARHLWQSGRPARTCVTSAGALAACQRTSIFNYVDGYLEHGDHARTSKWTITTRSMLALIYEFSDTTGGFLNGLSLSLAGQDILDEEPPVVLNGVVVLGQSERLAARSLRVVRRHQKLVVR